MTGGLAKNPEPAIDGLAFRPATAADWEALAGVVNRARRADGTDEVRTADDLASEHAHLDLARDTLVAEVHGRIAGYGVGSVHERDGALVAELGGAVDPAFRRRGVGTALFRRNLAALQAQLADDRRPLPREVRCYALDTEAADVALLAAEGFVPIRFGYEMRRPLTGILPERALPPGLVMRPPTEDEYRRVFDADQEAFRDHWGHRAPLDEDFQRRFYGPDMDPGIFCVAWDGDEVAGVVTNAVFAGENEALGIRRGWLEHVSVRRPWRGRGVAKALCAASFRILRDLGMDEAWLGVDGSNPTGAVRLYEGLGFHVVRGWKAYGRPLDGPAPAGWQSAGDRETMGA